MTYHRANNNQKEVIGLMPAGGKATRISPLPCSKELYPIGFRQLNKDGSLRPKVICHFLLEKMRLAGIEKTFIILRNGKWDIPAYLNDGNMLNMHFAYLMMNEPFGVPFTLDQAYPFIKDTIVAFGFPDIIFQPDDAFSRLLKKQSETNADIVLGLYVVDDPHKWDMVELSENDRIRRIIIKSNQTDLRYAWIIAIWTPSFTHFMHEYISSKKEGEYNDYTIHRECELKELFMGDMIQAAIDDDLVVAGEIFHDYFCLDIGTPDDLVKAVSSVRAL